MHSPFWSNDRVLLGGGGRQRQALLQAVIARMKPGGVVVIPMATLEAVAELRPLLSEAGWSVRMHNIRAGAGCPWRRDAVVADEPGSDAAGPAARRFESTITTTDPCRFRKTSRSRRCA